MAKIRTGGAGDHVVDRSTHLFYNWILIGCVNIQIEEQRGAADHLVERPTHLFYNWIIICCVNIQIDEQERAGGHGKMLTS